MKEETYPLSSSALENSSSREKASIGISIGAITLGLILIAGGIVSIPWIPEAFAKVFAWWFPYYAFVFSAIEIVSGLGMFFRKKWVLYLQIINFVANITAFYILNLSVINMSFFVHIAVIAFIAVFWRRLK